MVVNVFNIRASNCNLRHLQVHDSCRINPENNVLFTATFVPKNSDLHDVEAYTHAHICVCGVCICASVHACVHACVKKLCTMVVVNVFLYFTVICSIFRWVISGCTDNENNQVSVC